MVGTLMVAGCGQVMAGDPVPVAGQELSTATTTSSAQAASDYSLARLCELISSDEAVQFGGAAEGVRENSASDGHEICRWSDATALVVGFQEGPTTADVRTGADITNTPTTIDGLTAVQSLTSGSTVICQVLVDLPSGKLFTSAVGIRSAGEGKYDACQVATELSNLIIPRVKDQ